MDTAKEDSVDSAVTQTVKQFGRLDIAINNAGIGGAGKQTHEQELKDWQRVMDVNVNGVWMCQRAQIRQMLKQEPLVAGPRGSRGVIVNTASMLGLVASSPVSAAIAYTASKHGKLASTMTPQTLSPLNVW
jgi:NAD(P)-dependent dehydrogenase (short-subunit alcohol dehydrogenase family)